MSNYLEKISEMHLPVVVLRDTVPLPSVNTTFTISDKSGIAAARSANHPQSRIFIVAQHNITEDEPTPDSLYTVGIVAKIKHSIITPDGSLQIIVSNAHRGIALTYKKSGEYLTADILSKTIYLDETDITAQAYMREAVKAMMGIHKFMPHVSNDIISFAKAINDPAVLADYIAFHFLLKDTDKQQILEEFRPLERLELLASLLEEATELLSCEYSIHTKVQERLNRERRDYYLRQQIQVIEDELGEDDNENEEFYNKY